MIKKKNTSKAGDWDNEVEAFAKQTIKSNNKVDIERITDAILKSPSKSSDVKLIDGTVPLDSYKADNLDIATRIMYIMAKKAANGDIKCAEFVFKYGRLEPPKEQVLTVDLPVIIDDMSHSDEQIKRELQEKMPVYYDHAVSDEDEVEDESY